MPMRMTKVIPIQYAEKLPAVNPDRTLSEAPPSREDVTTSLTWAECIDVNTFTSSGMMAPAAVPHVMMAESFHHSVPSPRSGMMRREATSVRMIGTTDVSTTSRLSGG